MIRTALALAALTSFAATGPTGSATPEPVRYSGAPLETATLAPGPNLQVAQAQCGMCHSVDYITTQPRNFSDPRAVWTAEVAKMRKAYGAPLTDEDAAKIVDYLVATYGR
jgi:sulfite dehydrogenase (cytochrome) subunit B